MRRIGGLVVMAACGLAMGQAPRVELLGTLELPTRAEGPLDWELNEVSALEYVPFAGLLLAMGDDRSQDGPARVAVFKLAPGPDGVPRIESMRWRALTAPDGGGFREDTIDPESLRFLGRSREPGLAVDTLNFVVASEGYGRGGLEPSLFVGRLDGSPSTEWPAPRRFWPRDGAGIDHNRGFESLVVVHTGSGPVVYAGVEEPLRQDRPRPQSNENPGICRVVAFVEGEATIELGYPLGPGTEGDEPGTHALAELLALSPRSFLALENAKGTDGKGRTRLYWTTPMGASNLNDIESLRDDDLNGLHMMPKVLLADFADLGIDAGGDDWEGMTLGPDFKGGRTLLVSEDNDGKGPNRVVVLVLPAGIDPE